MDIDPHYGSICGFRGTDLNPDFNCDVGSPDKSSYVLKLN
jgi:hypothetical protein